MRTLSSFLLLVGLFTVALIAPSAHAIPQDGRYLYVAVPGIRNYLEYGGHGVLVYDIDDGHRLVRRIPSAGLNDNGEPMNVKGICASAATGRLYVSTIKTLQCYDLLTDELLWEQSYPGGCDRMSITADGRTLYVPSFEKDHWNVVDAADGKVVAVITPDNRAHNTIVSPDGTEVYLEGLSSPNLTVVDTATNQITRTVGPFSASIRPFTVNGRQTRLYANVNDLLGFGIGNLETGEVITEVTVQGFEQGPIKRHGCPSHGIALSLDETEVWLADAANQRVHVFDVTTDTPRQLTSIAVHDQPGWITFSIDGRLVYPSTGEVIDRESRQIIAKLRDEHGNLVMSEKMVEVDFWGREVSATGNQFAIGGVR